MLFHNIKRVRWQNMLKDYKALAIWFLTSVNFNVILYRGQWWDLVLWVYSKWQDDSKNKDGNKYNSD